MKKLMVFKSSSCAPCKALFIVLEKNYLPVDKITVVDIASEPELFSQYNVQSVPTSIILENDVEDRRMIGFTDRVKYLEFINK